LKAKCTYDLLTDLDECRWPMGVWLAILWIMARFRANGPTGISTWAVQLSLQEFARIFPSESCCINILADIVTNKPAR